MKRSVSSLRDSEIAFAVAGFMDKNAKKHASAGRLWEGSLGHAISILFNGTLDEDRASMVRSFLRLNRINSYWENGVFKGWAVPFNPLSNWRNEIRFGGTKVDPSSLISPLPIDNVKISCAYCQQSFAGRVSFEAHKNGQTNCKAANTCGFCSKVFDTHHSMTAHSRLHGDQIDRAVLETLENQPGLSRQELEQLLGFNFSLKNAMTRLSSAGLAYHDRSKRWFKSEPVVESKTIEVDTPEPQPVVQQPQSSSAFDLIMKNIERLAMADLKKKHEAEYQALVSGIIDKLTSASVL